MVFSSLMFLFRFLPIVLLLYFAAPKRARNAILFLASLVFYAWGEPVYVVLMLFSTAVDFTHGWLVDSNLKKGNRARARYFVIESMVINLALLGFFKYSDFLIGNINALFGAEIPLLKLALPIGISFYTFQTMSYTVDIYRGQAKLQKNIISFGAYVALFPQLIAGPIVQYKTVAEELNHRTESSDEFAAGALKFMCGLGKKVLLANNIGLLWDTVSQTAPAQTSVLAAWLGITACCLQIYFDFSGYSDMAIGLGRMFGFHFLENLSVYCKKYYGILEKMAYFAWQLVPGVRLYPAGRQPRRTCKTGQKHCGGLAADRLLARRELEFRTVGRLLRHISDDREIFPRRAAEKASARCYSHLYAADCLGQLRAVQF